MRSRWVASSVALLLVGVLGPPGLAWGAAPPAASAGRIAYSVGAVLPDPDLEAGSQVFTINPGGTDTRQLTHVAAPAEAGDPSYSPDGTRIAYVSNVSGRFQVWIMSSDGSGQRALLDDPTRDAFVPRWSADGSHLVFTRCDSVFGFSECTTATVGADGNGLHDLTGGHWTDFAADYGPAGEIALNSTRGGYDSRILIARPGRRLHAVTDPELEAFWPDYSPGGRQILFGDGFDRSVTQTYSMRADGSHVRQLTHVPNGGSAGFSRWSPDGQHIVFDLYDGGGHDWLAVMDSDGSQVRKLLQIDNLTIADWGNPS